MFKKKWFKRLCIVIGALVALYLILFLVNVLCNVSLRKYIKSFEPVKYSADRVVPVKEDGHITITTDKDLRVMHLTDIHLGGGFWTYKNDKKTIYELITMLQAEAPDIVVCGGDNTYCLIPPGYNGSGTFNNKMVAKTFIDIFDHEQVNFTTVFGNHDTEAMDYASRQDIGDLYASDYSEYCFFEQEFSDLDAPSVPSVSNQFIRVKNTKGEVVKLIMLIDSNDYVDTSFMATVKGKYDVIHDAQVDWAADTIKEMSKEAGLPDGEYLKTITFLHIPIGEYRIALDELIEEVKDEKGNITDYKQKADHGNTEWIRGWWDEQIYYGGINRTDTTPDKLDKFFEVLCEDMDSVEAVMCGHDHVNNVLVKYKGVYLGYGYSVDNEAYGDKIMKSGLQRGAVVITIKTDGTLEFNYKNAYLDYGVDRNKFTDVYLDKPLYPESYRTVE